MPGVSVLVPWAGSCPHRSEAWSYVQSWYASQHPTWEIVVGIGRGGTQWCKAEAVADAYQRAEGDTLVIADADVIAPEVGRAVQEIADGGAWAMPHRQVFRLNEYATRRVLRGADPGQECTDRAHLTQLPYLGYPGGGITVLRREVYESAPLDPRFRGWGQEDEAWALALNLLHGKPWRAPGPMWHLWHPPQHRLSRTTGSYASRDLLQQYRRVHSRSGMQRFLAPARDLLERKPVPTLQ